MSGATFFRGVLAGHPGRSTGVLVEGSRVTWVGPGKPPRRADEEIIAGEGELIAPGFIDLQVNGYGGHDAAAGEDAIAAISAALPATGVTAFLPTLISRPVEAGAAFAALARDVAAPGARVLGAHLEGPFLNPAFRGAHQRECLAEPTPERVAVVARSRPRLVTLAPELPGSLEAVARLKRAGILVSAGHTGADFEQGRRAIEAGVRFATHLYNAMPPIHHRRPGIVLALLLDRRVTAGLIADGLHVSQPACELAASLKGAAKLALTTDQTAAAGAGAGDFTLSGRKVQSDGTSVRLADGTLAGSAATMDELVRRMAALPGVGAAKAVAMASTAPAAALREPTLGRIRVGSCADLVLLDASLQVRLTMVGGEVKYRR